MLKKGDPVVFHSANGGSAHGMEFGSVESIHGEWVAVRTMDVDGRPRLFVDPHRLERLDVTRVVVVPLKDIVAQDGDDSVTPHQVRHAQLVSEALTKCIIEEHAVEGIRDAIQRELIRMHSFGFMEGQGVTVSEPWDWNREGHRIASAFVRYHDYCVEQVVDGAEQAPDALRLVDFLIWVRASIRDGGAISADCSSMVAVVEVAPEVIAKGDA